MAEDRQYLAATADPKLIRRKSELARRIDKLTRDRAPTVAQIERLQRVASGVVRVFDDETPVTDPKNAAKAVIRKSAELAELDALLAAASAEADDLAHRLLEP
jgi:hypothetical protein